MSDSTDETELIGRNELGRFEPGNRCSANRSSRAAELKRAFAEAVTDSDVAEIARSLVKLAIDGDVQAAKLVLDRVCGKPDGVPLVAIQNNVTSQTSHEPGRVAALLEKIRLRHAAEQEAKGGERAEVLPVKIHK